MNTANAGECNFGFYIQNIISTDIVNAIIKDYNSCLVISFSFSSLKYYFEFIMQKIILKKVLIITTTITMLLMDAASCNATTNNDNNNIADYYDL